MKASQSSSAFPLLPHEPMVLSESQARSRRALAYRWSIKRESGSHKILSRPGWSDFVFAFHDREEIGPKMLARIAKNTGLEPKNL